jgi:hypothetical protein
MRTNTSLLMAALAVLIVSIGVGSLSSAQDVPCAVPAPLARTNGATWPKGTNVTVIINPTAFPTNEQRDAIKAAFDTWQNANTNSGVTFTVTTGTQPAPSQQINTYYITRGTTTTGGDTNIGYTGSPSTTGNTTQSAVTIVDSTMTRLSTITNMMVHEIGHTFGLDDCMSCTQGSTMMSTYRNDCFCTSYPCDQSAPFNGMRWGCPPLTAPRDCEVLAVAQRSGYPPPPSPTPTPGGGGGGSCPNPNCNEGSGFPSDECQWGTEGCPSGYFNAAGCCQPYTMSPILIDVDGSGFQMTDAVNGVLYDFYGIQQKLQISWTAQGSTNAWLVLDRNGNGVIDSAKEMFGNITPQPRSTDANGFLALAEYDKAANGGNSDGVIDHSDAIFSLLRLWQDENHNGFSEWWELHALPNLNVDSISLDFRESRRTDRYGNQFRYRAKVKNSQGVQLGRWAWDVFLIPQ